jgi:LuxR family transcriptional regulator, quorum-sensing system regulator LasR
MVASRNIAYLMNKAENLNELPQLLECRSMSEWSATIVKLARQHDFPYIYFGIKPSRAASCRSAFVQTNFPTAWQRLYNERYYQIDPVALHCQEHIHPLVWDTTTFATEQQQEFFEEGCQYGLRSGIGFPIYGPQGQAGVLCLASDGAARYDVRVQASLSLLRDYACESYLKVSRSQASLLSTLLTPRELECLKWVIAGKSSWETSRILSCSEATINFHISNLTKKFGVQTRAQAVVRAISEGVVALD